MQDMSKQKDAGRSVFLGSVKGLANTAAAAAAFFGTPLVYSETVGWVQDFTYRHYGADLVGLVQIGWFGIVGFAVFFVARASIGTAIVMGGTAIAIRFL